MNKHELKMRLEEHTRELFENDLAVVDMNELFNMIDDLTETSKNFHGDGNWEKLSEEWIDENSEVMRPLYSADTPKAVKEYKLKNLLIPSNAHSKTTENTSNAQQGNATDKDVATTQENAIFATDTNVGHQVRKVTIPQFVADWIERCKEELCLDLWESMCSGKMSIKISDWLETCDVDEYARAWLDGYVVEQEQLYTVTMKDNSKLVRMSTGLIRFVFDHEIVDVDYNLTQSEIELVDPVLMGIAKEVEG